MSSSVAYCFLKQCERVFPTASVLGEQEVQAQESLFEALLFRADAGSFLVASFRHQVASTKSAAMNDYVSLGSTRQL